MTKIVYFLSASDRLNYGDLLFPILFKSICDRHGDIEFRNYALVSSNLAHFGALPTKSYKVFMEDVERTGGNVVVGGGEVLFPSCKVLYSFISPIYSKLVRSYKIGRLEDKIKFASFILSNGKTNYPFSPSKSGFSQENVKIFYNSVGGGFEKYGDKKTNNILKNNLLDSDYISVRDSRSYDSLLEHDVPCTLSPDSALIMSDVFPEIDLRDRISIGLKNIPEKYLFLQLGLNKAPKKIETFAKTLIEQANILGCEVLLCPIGKAPGHEDHIVLSRIASMSGKLHLVDPESIFDIMFLIATSHAYLGTSLHGLITAQSYDVPFIPLNKDIPKLNGYCSTWLSDVSDGCIGFDEINLVSMKIEDWNYERAMECTAIQKEKVYANFNTILSELLEQKEL